MSNFLQKYFKREIFQKINPSELDTDLKKEQNNGLIKYQLDVLFLLDVSESMGNRINFPKKTRRIDVLRRIMKNYNTSTYVSFSHNLYPNEIPEPHGSTGLGYALEYVYKHYDCKNIILITDGEPNDENFMLCMVNLDIPINIIYIGKERDRGEDFSKRLCLKTKGRLICIYDVNDEIFENKLQLAADNLSNSLATQAK